MLQEFYSSNVYRLSDLDYNFKINSRWIVIRTNVQYNDDNGSNGEFQIRITAYYLSSPNRIRSIYSSAK
ncbi:MAG: DUF7305 domain-containing protein, partial [Dictyoglomus sp.]